MKAKDIKLGHLIKCCNTGSYGFIVNTNNTKRMIVFFKTRYIFPVDESIDDYEDLGEFNIKFTESVITRKVLDFEIELS